MKKKPRILFATGYTNAKKPVDLLGLGMRKTSLRMTFPRVSSWGLRFIKQNFPQIEIMEHPTWKLYTKKIQEGWKREMGLQHEMHFLSESHIRPPCP